MLHKFTEAHSTSVGPNWGVKLAGQQKNCQVLINTAHTAGVNLQHGERLLLQQLLEHDAVLTVLARCHFDPEWLQCAGNPCMAHDVVRTRWLFNKIRVESGNSIVVIRVIALILNSRIGVVFLLTLRVFSCAQWPAEPPSAD